MRFEVVGTGAIGLLLAAKLELAGFSVTLWSRTKRSAEDVKKHGIIFTEIEGNKIHTIYCNSYAFGCQDSLEMSFDSLQASRESDEETVYGILAVKQTHIMPTFLQTLSQHVKLRKYAALVVIQNGVGHVERLADFVDVPIISAVTSVGAKRNHSYEIFHTGNGATVLGDELGRDIANNHQKNIEYALKTAGLHAFVSKNIKEYIYRKLIINSVINPLTAIYDVRNGELPLASNRLQLMDKLFQESKSILLGEEAALASITFDDILQVCHATSGNTSSMRADLLGGRITEIISINGAILEIAARRNKKAPLNESMLHLIEAMHPDE